MEQQIWNEILGFMGHLTGKTKLQPKNISIKIVDMSRK